MAKNPCMTCRFAKWDRTATGRLSPSGYGRCLWPKPPEPSIPKAFYWFGAHAPSGGSITRHDDDKDCPCYEQAS